MLNRQHRFHGYGSLRRVYSKSQSVRGSVVSVRSSPRNPNKPYRIAVVVSKKVHKSAVVRNRIRRRIYEIVRKQNSVPGSTDIILTVYSDQVADMPHKELETIIHDLLSKITSN